MACELVKVAFVLAEGPLSTEKVAASVITPPEEAKAWIDGSMRHEIKARDGHHHHHYLICRTCHKVEPISDCVVERFEDQIAKERGYAGLSHSLQLSGVCPACQKPAGNTRKKRK